MVFINRGLEMKKYLGGIIASLVALLVMAPLALAEGETAAASEWAPIGLGIMMGLVVYGGTTAQGRAIVASVESMGRNPSVAGKVQLAMILGLALIESLVIIGFVVAYLKF